MRQLRFKRYVLSKIHSSTSNHYVSNSFISSHNNSSSSWTRQSTKCFVCINMKYLILLKSTEEDTTMISTLEIRVWGSELSRLEWVRRSHPQHSSFPLPFSWCDFPFSMAHSQTLLGAGRSEMYSPGVSEIWLGGRDYIYPHKLPSKESRERKTGGTGGWGSWIRVKNRWMGKLGGFWRLIGEWAGAGRAGPSRGK